MFRFNRTPHPWHLASFICLQAADADKLLAGLASKAPASGAGDDVSLAPQLLRAQLALEDGNVAAALSQLAALGGGLAVAPGVLATRVALMEQVRARACVRACVPLRVFARVFVHVCARARALVCVCVFVCGAAQSCSFPQGCHITPPPRRPPPLPPAQFT
mgnify:CR=1 FL=1